MPPIPPPLTKQVRKHVSTALDVAKLTYRLLRATKQLEFSTASQDPLTGRTKHTITHSVDLTDDEHDHLERGGRLILVHACGWQAHVKI